MLDSYINLKEMKRSLNSTIYEAIDSRNSERVILKVFQEGNYARFEIESRFYLAQMIHPFFLECTETNHDSKLFLLNEPTTVSYLRLERADHGDLLSLLEKTRNLPAELVRRLFKDILNATETLYNSGVYHKSLNLQHILIDKNFRVRICDLIGLAPNPSADTECDDPDESPDTYESIENEIVKKLGGILFYMLTGKRYCWSYSPYDCHFRYFYSDKHQNFWSNYEMSEDSFEIRHLIQRMITPFVSQRISLASIKQHPWMKGTLYSENQCRVYFTVNK